MAEKKTWYYEKIDEKGKLQHAPIHDLDGKITGKCVYGLKAWFDEHPEERIRLGWTKHITHKTKDIEYNCQTQYLTRMLRAVDEWTVEDVYKVMDKSPEMMRLEELSRSEWFGVAYDGDSIVMWGED